MKERGNKLQSDPFSGRLEGIREEEGPIKCSSLTFPLPDTPIEPMEFLERSWSLSALEVSKALTTANHPMTTRYKEEACVLQTSTEQIGEINIPDSPGEHTYLKEAGLSLKKVPSQELLYNERLFNNGFYKSVMKGRVVRRWLKDQKEKRKEEYRANSAQIHAATSVAGVAAAIAAIVAATASVSCAEQERAHKSSAAIASAAALVASHCVEMAELMGANRDNIVGVINSAMNVRTSGDIRTLTAGAATALRSAAILRTRLQKVNANAVSRQCDKPSKEQEGLEFSTPINYVSDGGYLLKRTRKGILHWKHVSVYLNSQQEVIVKLQSKHIGGTFVKKKKSIVYDVCPDIPQWWQRSKNQGGETTDYFGLQTARGLIQFECRNRKNKQNWVQGVQQLLLCRGNETIAASLYKERKDKKLVMN